MQSKEEITAGHWLKETRKGYIRLAILILLSKKPHHGYEIMREIKERTGGFWRPTAGGIYPLLQNLEVLGYIEGAWDSKGKRKRKKYKATEAGRLVLERALTKENQLANSMSDLFKEFIKDVLDVEVKPTSMPKMPNPFSVFLEERKEKPEDTTTVLENKRTQIENMIKELHEELETINKRLVQLNQGKERSTPNHKRR